MPATRSYENDCKGWPTLSEGVLRPEEMQRVTIAESTIAENLRNILCSIGDSLRELREAMLDLSKGMRESVRVRSDRVLESLNRAFENFRNYMGHFVRVRLGLDNKDLYHEVFKGLRSSLLALRDVSWKLRELSSKNLVRDELSTILDVFSKTLEVLASISDAVMVLLDNPRGSIDVLSDAHRKLHEIEESVFEALTGVEEVVLRELYTKFVELLRSLSTSSENLMWIAMQRM